MDPKLHKLAKEWFQFAENDLQVANKLYKEFNAITCFHCQQAAEKYIKGLLIYLQIEFRRSHNLNYLLELLDEEISDKIFEAAEYLNVYAVETRYPGNYPDITDEETSTALEHTMLIEKFILDLFEQQSHKES